MLNTGAARSSSVGRQNDANEAVGLNQSRNAGDASAPHKSVSRLSLSQWRRTLISIISDAHDVLLSVKTTPLFSLDPPDGPVQLSSAVIG